MFLGTLMKMYWKNIIQNIYKFRGRYSMLNCSILIGRLAQDPELRYTSNGTPVCNFSLAVERNFSKENKTDFIKIVAWRKQAENCGEYLKKGRLVAVRGSLQIRENESKGRTFENTEVVANEVVFLDKGKNDFNRRKSEEQEEKEYEETASGINVPF